MPTDENEELVSGVSYLKYHDRYSKKLSKYSEEHNISLNSNLYANVVHDLVWTMALRLSAGQKTHCGIQLFQNDIFTYKGTAGDFTVGSNQMLHRNINIIQVKALDSVHVATYNSILGELRFSSEHCKTEAPSDELPLVILGAPAAYTAVFSLLVVIVLALETALLVLYICFRKQPEIKSTSFSLSLFMFFGCYLTSVYSSLALYFQQPLIASYEVETSLCNVRLWFTNMGLHFIQATLLVKILRVYHIFFRLETKPIGRKCSDTFLAAYVLVIVSPSVLILTVWTITDNFDVTFTYTSNHGYTEVEKECGPFNSVWYILLALYGAVLSLGLLILAIKSRRIRHKHFKDTKKVNMFLFLFNITVLMTFGYWWFLERSNSARYIAYTPIHIGLSVVIMLCQLLLFAPKVLPPFKRYLLSTLNKQHWQHLR